MKLHIKNWHPKVYSGIANTEKSSAKKRKSNSEIMLSSDSSSESSGDGEGPVKKTKKAIKGPMDQYTKSKQVAKNSTRWNRITDGITGYIVEAMAPLRTVELDSFRKLVHILEPGLFAML